MTAATIDQTTLTLGDWYYVTDQHGEIADVFIIAEPFDHDTDQGFEFAWTLAHQRPAGDGWGDKPAAEQLNHRDQTIALMWVRTAH